MSVQTSRAKLLQEGGEKKRVRLYTSVGGLPFYSNWKEKACTRASDITLDIIYEFNSTKKHNTLTRADGPVNRASRCVCFYRLSNLNVIEMLSKCLRKDPICLHAHWGKNRNRHIEDWLRLRGSQAAAVELLGLFFVSKWIQMQQAEQAPSFSAMKRSFTQHKGTRQHTSTVWTGLVRGKKKQKKTQTRQYCNWPDDA